MTVIYWGTYDKGKPRNRIMIRGLRDNGIEVQEIHRSLWAGVEDKSQLKGTFVRARLLILWLLGYPGLIWKYLKAGDHDCVVVGYLGHLDVLVLYPFARLRKKKVVWDAFISLYDTLVCDRKMLSSTNPLAFLLFHFEKIACSAADLVILDTEAHASYFKEKYGLGNETCVSVPVGAETEQFSSAGENVIAAESDKDERVRILFYGQFIPLHGIETIIRAARLLKNHPRYEWTIIGTGQEKAKIKALLDEEPIRNLQWLHWVEYEELKRYIHGADICLGIFGESGKASRVVPNKVYQIVACGKPCITRDSDAIRELFQEPEQGLMLVEPGNPASLAAAVKELSHRIREEPFGLCYRHKRAQISPAGVGEVFMRHLRGIV